MTITGFSLSEFQAIAPFLPLAAFLLFLCLQLVFPRRAMAANNKNRLVSNGLLFLVNSVILRFLVPLSLIGVATWAAQEQVGLFNWHPVTPWLSVTLSVIALDFAIYWQHVATHKWPLLWRMHKVHHADTDMDVTTAIRFHPLELLLSLLFKAVCVIVLGAPILAIIIFELLLFIGPAFNHSNMRLPSRVDAALRWFIATPDTHRVHHSTHISEQNTNYGFFLIWWDKLFGTYTLEPKEGHEQMRIGLQDEKDQCDRIDQILVAPFK